MFEENIQLVFGKNGIPIGYTTIWDLWRSFYDDMSYKDHQNFYDEVTKIYPDQKHYNKDEALKYIKKLKPKNVLELGGWKGELAKHILSNCSFINSWTNVDISPLLLYEQMCKDKRYKLYIPGCFLWDRVIPPSNDTDLFLSVHTIEHIKAYHLIKLLNYVSNVPNVYLESPIKQSIENEKWEGCNGSHILEIGWEQIIEIMNSLNYSYNKIDNFIYSFKKY